MNFKIEQVALYPENSEAAIELLTAMGSGEWAKDHVVANGRVFNKPARSEADLAFAYDMGVENKHLELEVLDYTAGQNWMDDNPIRTPWAGRVSHIGMHCTEEELEKWRDFFAHRFIPVAQEVCTESHTNPYISGKRWYKYVIFNTYPILGVDVKFIVRSEQPIEFK